MKKKIGDITIEVPFWYRANRKFISDFFETFNTFYFFRWHSHNLSFPRRRESR